MKKRIKYLTCLTILLFPLIAGCEIDKIKAENEGFKKQIETLNADKSSAETQIKELTAKVEELTKAKNGLSAKLNLVATENESLHAKIAKKIQKKQLNLASSAPKKKHKK